jgi:hypothetical protein
MQTAYSLILKNQIEALENGSVDFLMYHPGSGGEFLSGLISKYSSRNYWNVFSNKNWFVSKSNNRTILGISFANKYFLANIENDDINIKDHGFASHTMNINQDYLSMYLNLDNHLNLGKKYLTPVHLYRPKYMNTNNTYVIYPDDDYSKLYTLAQQYFKIYNKTPPEAYEDTFNKSLTKMFSSTAHLKKIYMSRMFEKEYLEEMFNIESNEFHYELINWHQKNLNNLKKYKGIK